MSVPTDYLAPWHFVRPHLSSKYVRPTTQEERHIKDNFNSQKEGMKPFPIHWLSHMSYVLRDEVLLACGLSVTLPMGKVFLLVVEVVSFPFVIVVIFLLVLFFDVLSCLCFHIFCLCNLCYLTLVISFVAFRGSPSTLGPFHSRCERGPLSDCRVSIVQGL